MLYTHYLWRKGSRLFNLQNLSKESVNSVKCGVVVELVGEVQRNGLVSRNPHTSCGHPDVLLGYTLKKHETTVAILETP